MNCMPENCCVTASTKHERPGGRAGHGRRIGLGLLMVLPSLPGGLIVLLIVSYATGLNERLMSGFES